MGFITLNNQMRNKAMSQYQDDIKTAQAVIVANGSSWDEIKAENVAQIGRAHV